MRNGDVEKLVTEILDAAQPRVDWDNIHISVPEAASCGCDW